ncbi:molybdate ABC transporter substrate-binding protein [uncultured Clostridium sp.]|uniref:molybdate ABC transporter substrate-binding protein n=1 Tax=uncultured Clostridium sp. TaxID=59620 RepID=UPI00261695C0|nr:molybdate ABC transporter substrate-binding protein [uncultured Clostridium sp.]
MRKKVKFLVPMIACIGVIIGLVGCDKKGNNNEEKEIVVSIAASLKEPMDIIGANFTKKTGINIKLNAGSSGTLEKQIQNGADVDMFFSASKTYSDQLLNKGYIYNNKVEDILLNSLVVIGDKNIEDLKELVNVEGKIAIGEPSTVPAGAYAKESLEYYKIYSALKEKLVYGKSVTNVKEYVESGNAEYGFVYKTDAINLKDSKVVYNVNDDSHEKIQYTVAVLKDSKNIKETEEFLNYLNSDEAMKVFEEYGFAKNK